MCLCALFAGESFLLSQTKSAEVLPFDGNRTRTAVLVSRDVPAGETLSRDDLIVVDNGYFFTPQYSLPTIEEAMGRRSWIALRKGDYVTTPLTASSSLTSMAAINFAKRDFDKALTLINEAITKDPEAADNYRVRAAIYNRLNYATERASSTDKFLTLAADDMKTYEQKLGGAPLRQLWAASIIGNAPVVA